MTQKGRLNWQQLPARPPASLPARLYCVERHSQDSSKLAMENILGQLHCRCRRSCRRALSTRRQCATRTVSCVLDNKDFLYLCVCVFWLTVNPKLMLLSFCSLLFVYVRLYVCVRVNVCESLPRSYGCFRGPLWGHLCFYFINDSCAAYEDV